ncbi:MAG: alkaline phosphatase family protein [Acidobacteriota bacterium]
MVVPPSRLSFLAVLAAGAAPGLLAGTQVAGLLFFLNPHLPFVPVTVARGVVFYALLLGIVSLLVHAPLTRGRARRLRAWLPVSTTAVLASAGVGFWAHAYYFNFFLPPGINKRLLKAAIWLSLAALIGFYTVLIHRLRERPYGRRSLILFGLLAVASIYVVVERREAFRPRVEPSPRPTTFQASGRPMLCVVGIDAATLDAILPLAERGMLPFFDRIRREGARARLETLEPMRRRPLWLTLTTGKYPYEHRIVGDSTYDAPFLAGPSQRLHLLPLSLSFARWGTLGPPRPVTARDLRALNLWQILDRVGSSTAVVGWPSTTPQNAGGVLVPHDFFTEAVTDPAEAQIAPAALAERAKLFRTAPEELDPDEVSRFGETPEAEVLEALAGDRWREDLSFFLVDREQQVDALFVLLPGLRDISKSSFGGFSAVQFRGSQDEDAVRASRRVAAYYRHLDDFLAMLWNKMPSPRLLVVASSYGVREPNDLVRVLGMGDSVRGSFIGRPEGVLTLLGDGVRQGAAVREARLVDVVPTVLYGLGYPIARDLEGAVLTEVFDTSFLASRPLAFVPSYETFQPQLLAAP